VLPPHAVGESAAEQLGLGGSEFAVAQGALLVQSGELVQLVEQRRPRGRGSRLRHGRLLRRCLRLLKVVDPGVLLFLLLGLVRRFVGRAAADGVRAATDDRRAHVEGRLRANLMAWLTTVRPDGQPDSVPVWFLVRDDETILVYSQPKKIKLRSISENPKVTLGLDVTDIGRDIIRIDGTAEHVDDVPPADRQPQYAAKYAERIGAMFGTPRHFAELFSEALIITPSRLHA